MRSLLWLCALIFISSDIQAQAWRLAKDDAGIKVYLKPIEGSSFQAFRATAHIRASLSDLLALQEDVSSACRWMHACQEQRLLKQQGQVSWIYSQYSAPWPVKPRDSVVRVDTAFKADGSVMRFLRAEADYLSAVPGFVRVSKVDGFWQLTPVEGGVDVVYQVYSDPGGSVPAWLANSFVVDAPFNTLNGLRQLAENP